MPYKVFAAGEEALAADVNNHLMSQTVSRHASSAARTSAITAPVKGQMTVLDTDVFDPQIYTGSTWASLGPVAMRYFHNTGYGGIGSSANVSMPFMAFTYPRACNAIVNLQAYCTLNSGSGAGGWNFRVITNGTNAPAVAPFSFISQTPNFTGGTVPITAVFRNVPANTNIAPTISVAGTGGGAVLDLGALSGFMLFLPPNAEF